MTKLRNSPLALPEKRLYNNNTSGDGVKCVSEMVINESNVGQCQKMLSQLPGVFAAGIRFEQDAMTEIHILASTSRNAKQIVRDVQSAIFAAYGAEVDHRIVSVAQLTRNPSICVSDAEGAETAPQPVRLLFTGIDLQRRAGSYTVKVFLCHNGKNFSGEAQCGDTMVRRNRAIAQATLNAVHAFLGQNVFDLLDVKQAEFGGEPIVIAVIEQLRGAGSRILVGAVALGEDVAESIVRSTLDATNRRIGMLYRPESLNL